MKVLIAIAALALAPVVFAQAPDQTKDKEGCCAAMNHAACCKAAEGQACHKAGDACGKEGECCKDGACCEGGACQHDGCCAEKTPPADRRPGEKPGCCTRAPK